MNYLLLFLLSVNIACASVPMKTPTKTELKTLNVKQIFLDGCVNGVAALLISQGIPHNKLNIVAIVGGCSELTEIVHKNNSI